MVVGGLVASAVLDLGTLGVALVGDVPRGLPIPGLPDAQLVSENLVVVIVAAVGIVAIGFSQTAGDARYFATKHGYRIDIDQETVAEGMANLGAGMIQGIPVSTSLSASSLSDNAGAKSAMASLTTGAVVVLTLLVFAPLFSILPKAVLGAVIIDAVMSGMIDLPEMRRLRRVKPFDFGIAIAAILGVLTVGVLPGIVIGVVLSLLWLVYVSATPAMPVLARIPGTHVFREAGTDPDDEQFPGILALRLDGGLYFVTSDVLVDRIPGSCRPRPTLPSRRSCSTAKASRSSIHRAQPSSASSPTWRGSAASISGWLASSRPSWRSWPATVSSSGSGRTISTRT